MIELAGVSKAYGAGPVVRGLSLSVPAGAFLALVGGSGSGKTTTLKMINGLVRPDAGRVLLDGAPLDQAEPHVLRRGVGYVFQEVGLFPHMTVGENIAITPKLMGRPATECQARVHELLALVGLPADYAARRPAALSGGQRQRVGVARALAARPKVMLMDEPFGALDPVTRSALGAEYRRLHEQLGLTTVMVTHDMTEAVLLADRIAVLAEGRLLAEGAPGELARSPDEVVRGLLETPRRQAEEVRRLLDGAA